MTLLRAMKIYSTAFKISFLLAFLAILSHGPGRMRGTYARGTFHCPRMINCTQVCQGFANCCVNGECLCEECPFKNDTADTPSPDHRCNH